MKKNLFFMMVMLAGIANAYSQTKLQFIELQVGQSIMTQGAGFSLFDKAVGDNIAIDEAIHIGWGKASSHSIGAFLCVNTIEMPRYDEVGTAFSFGIETRNYLDITESIRCYSNSAIGGIYMCNDYTLNGIPESASRWGILITESVGAEKSYGEHLYLGASLHLTLSSLFTSTFEPSATTPQEGSNTLLGNKIMFTAGYRF